MTAHATHSAARFVTLAVSFLSTVGAQASMFPPNNLYKEDGREVSGGITEQQVDAVVNRIKEQYLPFAKEFKADLVIVKHWSDRNVNAFAGRTDNDWQIHVFGGLARRKEITSDAFTLVTCHEAGHLFGGYPFYQGDDLSSEGQADYFATQICARSLWSKEAEENAKHVETVNVVAKKSCDDAWQTDAERHLCYRIADASGALGKLLARMSGETISFETPDTTIVKKTIDNDYPSAQCRLDTYLTAALCKTNLSGIKIPGFIEPGKVLPALESEGLAFQESCAEKKKEIGFRPSCWFASVETTPPQ